MTALPHLQLINAPDKYDYAEPVKKIHDGADVQFFLQSYAYRDISTFILQLNRSLVPRKRSSDESIAQFNLNDHGDLSPAIESIQQLISKLDSLIAEAPPETGPRRFGNVAFRTWYTLAEIQAEALLESALPIDLRAAIVEVKAYLLGSFGSPQRLDYGTGHELSFIAFLACLWKIGYFKSPSSEGTERQIVLALFQPYLLLIRKLIITYNLEPAGSHGVWGLDDNSFLPYMFGSAQLCPAISDNDDSTPTPISGSLPAAPDASIVTKQNLVEKEASSNMYFGAINFIYAVKRGPFWEHSPMLFDISGIKDGWGKINKGLIKMYDAEVLAKFPVVQHFPFGNIFRWEKDPTARPAVQSTHTANQPLRDPMASGGSSTMRPPPSVGAGTAAPWTAPAGARAAPKGFVNGVTQAPWANTSLNRSNPPSTYSQASRTIRPLGTNSSTSALLRPNQRPAPAVIASEDRSSEKTAETIPENNET